MGVLGAAPARFRRPHVLHADVGELTLHLALLDLKLAWSLIQAMERARKKLNFKRKTHRICSMYCFSPAHPMLGYRR